MLIILTSHIYLHPTCSLQQLHAYGGRSQHGSPRLSEKDNKIINTHLYLKIACWMKS